VLAFFALSLSLYLCHHEEERRLFFLMMKVTEGFWFFSSCGGSMALLHMMESLGQKQRTRWVPKKKKKFKKAEKTRLVLRSNMRAQHRASIRRLFCSFSCCIVPTLCRVSAGCTPQGKSGDSVEKDSSSLLRRDVAGKKER
jgi:hypothetical protein